ncbi:hypothetical protein EJ06DRAFT_487456, partial [Trichodelitschia bisporula]
MAKDRAVNPATAALKAAKNKSIKKSKAALAAQRAEKLSKRNPARLQKQIDELVAVRDASGGVLRPRDKEVLERLEKELGAVKRARETLGVKGDGGGGWRGDREGGAGGVLGKRSRDDAFREPESSDSDPDVRDIPMPLDVEHMPPVPRRRGGLPSQQQQFRTEREGQARGGERQSETPRAAPVTVYEAAPQVRDLRKEAVRRFVPQAVAGKLRKVRGEGGLVEPEEAERLEREGY